MTSHAFYRLFQLPRNPRQLKQVLTLAIKIFFQKWTDVACGKVNSLCQVGCVRFLVGTPFSTVDILSEVASFFCGRFRQRISLIFRQNFSYHLVIAIVRTCRNFRQVRFCSDSPVGNAQRHLFRRLTPSSRALQAPFIARSVFSSARRRRAADCRRACLHTLR